ncbi:MAG TPA: acyltransferase [Acidimicrobiales bacterium]|nr:acyltransferase [Acidimicrobiales bacterium]
MPDESPLTPAAGVGTRKRLDHIDAMRPVKQVGVVSTHTLLFFAPLAAAVTVGASLQLLHVTREAFLFVSACMLTYSVRDLPGIDHRTFWRRRFSLVAVPYVCWSVIYFVVTIRSAPGTVGGDALHLLYLVGTGYYQLYYLLVLLEFYALFPLCLILVRRTVGHHGLLLLASGAAQVALVSAMHWGLAPGWMTGYWATREVTSYQFYLIAGMVMALHLDEFHRWLCTHVWTIVTATVAAAVVAEAWYYLSVDHVMSWLGSSADPFQPVVIPFNIGAIACIYLIGVALVDRRRSRRVRRAVHSGSDNSYGVYLAQLLFITVLSWLGWEHLNGVLPWPVVSALTVVVVFAACLGLTELLARTPWAKPLTGRSRVPWRAEREAAAAADPAPGVVPAGPGVAAPAAVVAAVGPGLAGGDAPVASRVEALSPT